VAAAGWPPRRSRRRPELRGHGGDVVKHINEVADEEPRAGTAGEGLASVEALRRGGADLGFHINDVTINLSTDNNDLQIFLLGWEFQTYQFV
jgi:hypothetical protein